MTEESTNWKQRFPHAEVVVAMEGGTVYSAKAEGSWWLITNEHSMLEGTSSVSIVRFDDPVDWKQALVAKRGIPTRLFGERALVEALPRIAKDLEALAVEQNLSHVNERDHLQPLAFSQLALTSRIIDRRSRVELSRKLDYPTHFPRVGDVDMVIGRGAGEPLFVELKCGAKRDSLGYCAWDLLKCGLTVRMGSTPAAYLLAATTNENWELPVRGSEFFNAQSWSTAEVRTAYEDWFRSFEKLSDPRPDLLPARGRTVNVADAGFSIGDQRWTLKLARVEVEPRGWFEWHPLLSADGTA